MYDNFSEYDNLPRNAPKPIDPASTNASPIMQPSVPEVSIIQGPTNYNTFGQKTSSTPNIVPPTNYQQFKLKNFSNKLTSPSNSPIVSNTNNDGLNPEVPKSNFPELSILVPQSALHGANFGPTNNNNLGLNCVIDQSHSSLPIKSFSSFKREYQHKIDSIQNCTKNNIKILSNNNNLGKSYLTKENEQIKNLISRQCNCNLNKDKMASMQNSSNHLQNNDLLTKIDQLTNLVQTMYIEMIGIKGELSQFKNYVENHLSSAEKLTESEHTNGMNYTNQYKDFENSNRKDLTDNNDNYVNIDLTSKDLSYNKNEFPSPRPIIKDTASPGARETPENKIFDIQSFKNEILSSDLPTVDDYLKPKQKNYRKLDTLDPLPENSLLVLPNDRSLAMEKLAAKYLPEGKYKVYVNNDNQINNKNIQMEKKLPTDMSIGSYDYLKKYKLLPTANENDENILFVQDIKKQPKFI